MSLTISLRVPDGIVLAADSLSTQTSAIHLMAEFQANCPKCKEEFPIKDLGLPPLPITSSTRSFAQKMSSLKTKDNQFSLGIATFGMGVVNKKTIYYHIRLLNQEKLFSGLVDASDTIAGYFSEQLTHQFGDLSKAPKDLYPLGFQVVGYEEDTAKTILVHIGREIKIDIKDKIGCTYGCQ